MKPTIARSVLITIASLLMTIPVAAQETKKEFIFSIEGLEEHKQAYQDLIDAAGATIPMEDGYVGGYSSRSASTMANGIAYMIDIEDHLSKISTSLQPETLQVVKGVIAQQYSKILVTLQSRYKGTEKMREFINSPLTTQFLDKEMKVDEQCYSFIYNRLRELLGEHDISGEQASKAVNETISSILKKKTTTASEAVEISKSLAEFGLKMNQKIGKLMSEGILSSEMSDAPMMVGYVGQGYNAIFRNSSFLTCNESIALVISDSGTEALRHTAMETLLIAHLKYFIKTGTRISMLNEYKRIYGPNPALIKRLDDLQNDLSKAKGLSNRRIQELLKTDGFREKLSPVIQTLLKENGV